ncbi:MAG TPA: tRNA-dihydrouridine synthase [Anaerohalosphaeraceae bacterium]|nr:tRNA-dihydrouridine synthase [Anaerohalosphaeraceae bacterium]HPP55320.1 tRNA-dihydrouridine synthase [Anaerohalosphaeraceae bacterium]
MIKLDMPFIQAALSGYTDHPMRILARRFGCPLVFTGVMLDRIALHPKASRQKQFYPFSQEEHPVVAQIMGNEPEVMAQSAAVFERAGYDAIDLNFACPVPKVLRRERGGYLMQKPAVVREAYLRTREAVRCPVFMKIRIGFDSSEASQEDFWTICENAVRDGVQMLAIHGRTVEQKYKGTADWERITEVKRRFPSLCVFGSGDILKAQTAIERLNGSGVDGVIVARGAIGNPWIFQEIRALWEGCPLPEPPTMEEQKAVMEEHLRMILEFWPARKAIPYFRKFTAGYCKRHPQRKQVMMAMMKAKTLEQVQQVFAEFYPEKNSQS